MASVINTNMASLYAQKNLSGAQNALATSVERLSSGLRINRAKDDAAGLGISEKIKSQVTSLNQGVRNANDAISMVQAAEGSLSEVSTILQRMKELSVQARNESLSTTQRSYISDELVALKKEVNAIAERTTFNDLSLLKNALRTDVVTSTAANKLQNGATVLDGIAVSGVTLKNTNAGTYSFTTGTVEEITGQKSRASSAYIGTVGVDTTQSASWTSAGTSSATNTLQLAGVFEVNDTVTLYIRDDTAGSVATVSYTVTGEDLTLNGDGTGGDVTGGSTYALNNIATKIASQSLSGLAGASVANITMTASGSTVNLTDARATGSISVLVSTAAASTAATTDNLAANRIATQRDITIASDDVAEGNRITLTIAGKDYTVVAGSESTKGSIAVALQSLIAADYATGTGSSVTAASGVIHLDWDGLSTADVSMSVKRFTDGAAVSNIASVVSDANISNASVARTITINDNDVVEGRKFTVSIGNPETSTSYSVVADYDDTAATIAAKLEDLMDDNLGVLAGPDTSGTSVASNVITIGASTALGMSVINLSVKDMVESESLTPISTVESKTRAETARTITINDNDLAAGNVVSVSIRGKEYAVQVESTDTAANVAYKLGSLIDDDYPNTDSATATTQFPAATRNSVTGNVITLTSSAKLGLEEIGVSVRKITNPGLLTITANADTGIGGTKQSVDIGSIAAGGSKTFDFDNLGISFTLNNSRATAVNSASFAAYSSRVNELSVGAVMDGEALFQVGAGTRDTVVLDGFKDIRITGYNQNSGAEKTVFDNLNSTLNTISQNTTESLSEANFATLENQIEDAITMVADFRGYFGAQQNRIEFAIANIQAQSENLSAANSRIVDTDYAAETANLTKTQIMQQAATAMLAQANQMPNVILALLK